MGIGNLLKDYRLRFRICWKGVDSDLYVKSKDFFVEVYVFFFFGKEIWFDCLFF